MTAQRNPRPKQVYTLPTLLARTEEVGDCLEWASSYTCNGHPTTRHHGAQWLVRRLVLTLQGIDIKPGHVVVTTCKNLRCINPEHLVQRTERQHMLAMGEAGKLSDHRRSAKIAATKRAGHQAKLTEAQVRESGSAPARSGSWPPLTASASAVHAVYAWGACGGTSAALLSGL